jgi:protein-tyrosine phosphatase
MAEKKVLFLCTGNFYRSRFAEILFNALAAQAGLDWSADSSGLATENYKRDWGAISPFALHGLEARGIRVNGSSRYPKQLSIAELQTAGKVIALCESEHRPYLQSRFQGWEQHVEYWQVSDLNFWTADHALAEIEHQVRNLVSSLAGNQ